MREKIRDKGRLEHILEAIENVFEFMAGVSFEEYQSNKMLRFAVVKNLEIIGEASYHLTPNLKDNSPEIEWRVIIGMRHVLVHDYFLIGDEVVWNVVQKDLLPLKENISLLLDTID
ncbi:MAG: DUF86 domain-containing protein [Candidatus Symbiothrix sp.]|jgi:uncharacterized protein with HEPN domain|nr:DUF86 domain-containing protein [Candidatus Symbiothrix sp.]